MTTAMLKNKHPYVVSDPEIAGGSACIEGTRITVRCIAGYYEMGMTVDEILLALRHLKPAHVHSALAYYFDHKQEIVEEMQETSDESHWKSQVLHAHSADSIQNRLEFL